MVLPQKELSEFLEFKYHQYNSTEFIETDPISIPHLFTKKEDIEIAGFLTATISWGNRKSILKNAKKLMEMMDHSPYSFVMDAEEQDLEPLRRFVHRTFNGEDCLFFIKALRNCYQNHGGLENIFTSPLLLEEKGPGDEANLLKGSISRFRKTFLETEHLPRSEKHIADPSRNSSAKRILMFLRWMVRQDQHGVDFGLWKGISPADLMCPLDVHSGNVARKLGLLYRIQNDWKAVEELTANLRKFDANDPVKYDFALFGLGVFERF
ncbi:MAG: TIGR02757 family protein [Bacteroidota bacterium]